MKNVLILHGAANNSQGNWFPWLASELKKKSYSVWCPDLPNSDEPIQKDWLNTIFSNRDWVFDKESIIIGHSAGATLVLRILESLPENTKIDKAILVAGVVEIGTKESLFQYKRSLVASPFDWTKIKKSAQNFYFICSDNDPYQCGSDQAKIMHQNLGGELIIKSEEGHFNLEVGERYKKFPLLIDLVEK